MRQDLLHEILKAVIDRMVFRITWESVTDNTTTYSLNGICNLHHVQPGFSVTIATKKYSVVDYVADGSKWSLILKAGSNPLPASSGTFDLYPPYFVHGTPMQQEVELSKIPTPDKKTPLIYLMEPYDTEYDYTTGSSIDSRSNASICFLTQADTEKWKTDDFFHNAINPMVNLMRDFIGAIRASNLFYTAQLTSKVRHYTRFGINIREEGTKKLYFTDKLSGSGLDMRFQVYRLESCDCCNSSCNCSGNGNPIICDDDLCIEVD